MQDRKGGCLCGAVRYVLKGEPRAVLTCHCTHCQKQSGSSLSFNLLMREADYDQQGETKVYVDPPTWGSSGGHAFSRRVDPKTLARVDSPEQVDSWNRTWAFFDWHLRPYFDASKPSTSAGQNR